MTEMTQVVPLCISGHKLLDSSGVSSSRGDDSSLFTESRPFAGLPLDF